MAYNTKPIKNDVDGKPIPQYYNPDTDLYEALQGSNGAANHTLHGIDGEPITTTGNKLAVRATEVETLLGTIEGKDFATQTTLAQILAKLISAPATEAKQTALNTLIGEVQAAPTANTLLARLKNLETKVDAIIADGVKLSGSILAKDPVSGDPKPLSAIPDLQGNWVLRTSPASHVAYDIDNDVYKILPLQQNKSYITVLERAVRSVSMAENISNIDVPESAKSVHVMLSIYGITGSFADGQGINLRFRSGFATVAAGSLLYDFTTDKVNSFSPKTSGNTGIIISQNVDGISASLSSDYTKLYKIIDAPLIGSVIKLGLLINGTFGEGEGFDCDLKVMFF